MGRAKYINENEKKKKKEKRKKRVSLDAGFGGGGQDQCVIVDHTYDTQYTSLQLIESIIYSKSLFARGLAWGCKEAIKQLITLGT